MTGTSTTPGHLKVGVLVPVAGTWRLFLQCHVDGHVITVPYTLRVAMRRRACSPPRSPPTWRRQLARGRRPGERLPASSSAFSSRTRTPRREAEERPRSRSTRRTRPASRSGRPHREQLRPRLGDGAVAQAADRMRASSATSTRRLQAAAADRHAERVRLLPSWSQRDARVRGARDDPDRAGRQRSRTRGARPRDEARRRGGDRRHGADAREDARATELAPTGS